MPTFVTPQTGDKQNWDVERFSGTIHPIVEQKARVGGQFKAATFTDAGTTALVTPPIGSGIVITDFIISIEKVTSGVLTVRFTDGTNNVDILVAQSTDAPVNLTFSPQGRWRGWEDARIDIIAAGNNVDGSASLGYYFISDVDVLPFAEWDALRG